MAVTGHVRGLGDRPRVPDLHLWLVGIAVLGAAIRGIPVIGAGFPLNDGGLFVDMMDALQRSEFRLPETVAYNGLQLPFAYPPAGLYVGAAWGALSGMSLIDTERLFPLLFSIATIPIAYAIYRPLLGTAARAMAATAGFALLARSYNWMITGGGITRGLGFLMAMATVAACIQLYQRPHAARWVVLTGVGAGLTALSHPQAAVFAGASMAVLVPFSRVPVRTAVARLVLSSLVGALIVSPWLWTVVARHGLATLMGAAQTGGTLQESLTLLFTFRYSDGLFEFLGIVGAFGLFVCLINRIWLFPLWTAVVFVVGARAGLTYATVPVGAAIAYGALDAFRLLRIPEPMTPRDWFAGRRAAGLALALLICATADSVGSSRTTWSPLQALAPDSQAAMAWAASHTPEDATFLIAAGETWERDAISEWFPVLTGRRSLATVQGWEWLGPGKFDEQQRRSQWLLNCAALTDSDCAAEWSQVVEPVDYVLVADGDVAAALGRPCCLQLADRLVTGGGSLAFSQGGVRIVLVTSGTAAGP